LEQVVPSVEAFGENARRLFAPVREETFRNRAARERRAPDETKIEGRAESVKVGPGVEVVAVDRLLRRQIVRGAENPLFAPRRNGCADEKSEAEVDDFHLFTFVY
jgi:hypothetical protein